MSATDRGTNDALRDRLRTLSSTCVVLHLGVGIFKSCPNSFISVRRGYRFNKRNHHHHQLWQWMFLPNPATPITYQPAYHALQSVLIHNDVNSRIITRGGRPQRGVGHRERSGTGKTTKTLTFSPHFKNRSRFWGWCFTSLSFTAKGQPQYPERVERAFCSVRINLSSNPKAVEDRRPPIDALVYHTVNLRKLS